MMIFEYRKSQSLKEYRCFRMSKLYSLAVQPYNYSKRLFSIITPSIVMRCNCEGRIFSCHPCRSRKFQLILGPIMHQFLYICALDSRGQYIPQVFYAMQHLFTFNSQQFTSFRSKNLPQHIQQSSASPLPYQKLSNPTVTSPTDANPSLHKMGLEFSFCRSKGNSFHEKSSHKQMDPVFSEHNFVKKRKNSGQLEKLQQVRYSVGKVQANEQEGLSKILLRSKKVFRDQSELFEGLGNMKEDQSLCGHKRVQSMKMGPRIMLPISDRKLPKVFKAALEPLFPSIKPNNSLRKYDSFQIRSIKSANRQRPKAAARLHDE